jgi:hypothetical protein
MSEQTEELTPEQIEDLRLRGINKEMAKWWDDRHGRMEEFIDAIQASVRWAAKAAGYKKDLEEDDDYNLEEIQKQMPPIILTIEEIDLFLFYRPPVIDLESGPGTDDDHYFNPNYPFPL